MAKGGARHLSKPMVDSMLVYQALKKNASALKDLGPYERISRSHAVDGTGLVHLEGLIRALLLLDSSAEVHPQPLRKGLLQVYNDQPSINTTEFNGTVWRNLKAERINVVMAHFRKVARDGITASLSAKLNPCSLKVLQALVGLVELRGEQTPEKGAALVKEQALEKEETPAKGASGLLALQDASYEPSSSSKRKLEESVSDVSCNSQGLPNMFASPSKKEKASSSLQKAEASKPTESFFRRRRPKVYPPASEVAEVAEGETLQKAMGFKSKTSPLARGKPAAKVPALAKAKAKLKALPKAKSKPLPEGRKPWLKLKKTCALKPKPRTYVTGTTSVGSKLQLICEVSSSMTPHHEWVVDRIIHALQTEHLAKGEALELRAKLLSEQ